jgi:hypothetical protein
MGDMSLVLVTPLLFFVSFVAASQIVLRRRIVSQTQALLVGIGGVPLALAGISYVACILSNPSNSALADMSATCGALGAMIGGWIGASVAYITNQARSGKPEMVQEYQNTIARAELQSRRKTVNDWLKRYGVPDTRRNVRLYLLGSFLVLISFMAIMNRMIILSFWDTTSLAHLPLNVRLVGAIAPFAGPGLLWIAVRRWLPALGFGLRDGVASLMLIYVPYYIVFNMLAAPPVR